MATAFSFNFVVANDDENFERCKPRLPATTFERSSPVSQVVGCQRHPAKQHYLDLQDDFYTELLDHVTLNFYQPDARKSSVGLCYLKLEAVKQWFQRKTATPGDPHSGNSNSTGSLTCREHALLQLLETTDNQHSDLLSGVYEGGLKVWECAFDLLEYLAGSGMEFSGKRVLDLGCGAGLLGIFALLSGAAVVHFQDYNPEVIECLTTANVVANCTSKYCDKTTSPTGCAPLYPEADKRATFPKQAWTLVDKCNFFSGDWTEFCSLLSSAHSSQPLYDIILTSETIYSLDSQPKLLQVLKEFTSPSGVVLVAAKSHYFGVGGSLLTFRRLVRADGVFDYSVVKEICACVPRQIIKLSYRMHEQHQ